jgi:post-GPI attachment to proteins factor 3
MKSTTILLVFAASAHASSGDRDDAFQSCLSHRISEQCRTPTPLPFPLQLMRWTCEDDCKYQCTHIMTDKALSEGRRPAQFYGKWAFWRFLGMQEPASVVFSLMNLWAHVRGGRKLRRRIRKDHPMKWYYLVFTIVSLNLWIWSAVFHTRGMS